MAVAGADFEAAVRAQAAWRRLVVKCKEAGWTGDDSTQAGCYGVRLRRGGSYVIQLLGGVWLCGGLRLCWRLLRLRP